MKPFDLEASLPPCQHVTVLGLRVAYRDSGPAGKDEAPFVFVHGLGSSSLTWSRLLEQLEASGRRRRRVILVDLPGFGKSDKPLRHLTLRLFGDCVQGVLSHLGVTRAMWVGHSMGGQVSILRALEHPEIFDRLFLIAPAGLERFSPHEGGMLRAAVTEGIIRRQRRSEVRANFSLAFDRWVPEADKLVEARMSIVGDELRSYAYAFCQAVDAMLREPVHSRWPELRVRTAVLFGARDRLIPNRLLHPHLTTLRLAESARRRLSGCDLTLVPNAGHMVHFEKPDEVGQALETFAVAPPALDAAG